MKNRVKDPSEQTKLIEQEDQTKEIEEEILGNKTKKSHKKTNF